MIAWSRSHTWMAGLAIILLTNAVALGSVAWNRSAEVADIISLTERELSMPYRWGLNRENSGISLRIRVRSDHSPGWLGKEKLVELGFPAIGTVATSESRRQLRRLPREAFVVLEQDGPAWRRKLAKQKALYAKKQGLARRNPDSQKLLREAERVKKNLMTERTAKSRLFMVDVGTDYSSLRRRYPDKTQYLIARGLVKAVTRRSKDGTWSVQGRLSGLSVRHINIPLAHREIFDKLKPVGRGRNRHNQPPRFSATLAYGKRYEPWVVAVEKITQPDG